MATATRAGVRVIPLGGAGEIGKNMYVIEHDGRMVLIDCGITFPKNDQMGVDIVLPDFSYVVERRDRLEATHPHPRPRGPHRRGPLPAARGGAGADLRAALHAGAAAAPSSRSTACSTAPS